MSAQEIPENAAPVEQEEAIRSPTAFAPSIGKTTAVVGFVIASANSSSEFLKRLNGQALEWTVRILKVFIFSITQKRKTISFLWN